MVKSAKKVTFFYGSLFFKEVFAIIKSENNMDSREKDAYEMVGEI